MNGARGVNRAPGAGRILVVGAGLDAPGELVEEFFVGRGWRAVPRGPGRTDFECGSRRRTILLGALARRGFHLLAPIEVREGSGAAEIRYLWGETAGRALGGSRGRARALRVHQETADALQQELQATGQLLQVRRV